MRLLYKAVAAGAAGAAGLAPTIAAAGSALMPNPPSSAGCGHASWTGKLTLCDHGDVRDTDPVVRPDGMNGWRAAGTGYGHGGANGSGNGYGSGGIQGTETPTPSGGVSPTPSGSGGVQGGPTPTATVSSSPGGSGGVQGTTLGGSGGVQGTTPGGSGGVQGTTLGSPDSAGAGGALTPGGSGEVLGATAGGGAAGAGTAGALALTGADSPLLTTLGVVFIVGGAGILYFTRFGEDRTAERPGRVPTPRRGRHAASGDEARPVRRRRPSPTPPGRRTR